jgi:hypothetical protein
MVTVDVPVKVKDVSVSEIKNVDSKYKDSVPKLIKPLFETGLAKIKVEIPNGKKLGALAVEVGISINRTDKGLYLSLEIAPSEGNFMLGRVHTGTTVPLDKGVDPDDGDVKAAGLDAAKKGIAATIAGFKIQAKK